MTTEQNSENKKNIKGMYRKVYAYNDLLYKIEHKKEKVKNLINIECSCACQLYYYSEGKSL